jgi:hypothetical protein
MSTACIERIASGNPDCVMYVDELIREVPGGSWKFWDLRVRSISGYGVWVHARRSMGPASGPCSKSLPTLSSHPLNRCPPSTFSGCTPQIGTRLLGINLQQ